MFEVTMVARLDLSYFGAGRSLTDETKRKIFMNLIFCNMRRRWLKCNLIFFLKCKILRENIFEIISDFGIKRLPRNLEAKATSYIVNFSKIGLAEKRLEQIRQLLTLVSEFLKRARKKKEVELDSLLLYLFYCILLACPRNMVSDVKLLYMSLPKEDEIRILGNLAVQLLASLQFLSKYISDLCKELRIPNHSIYDFSEVGSLRKRVGLDGGKRSQRESFLQIESNGDEQTQNEPVLTKEFGSNEDSSQSESNKLKKTEKGGKEQRPSQMIGLKNTFNGCMSEDGSLEDEYEKEKRKQQMRKTGSEKVGITSKTNRIYWPKFT